MTFESKFVEKKRSGPENESICVATDMIFHYTGPQHVATGLARARILNRRPDLTARGINAAATVRFFRHGLHCHIIITRDFNMHDIF